MKMTKYTYEEPKVEIVALPADDVISTSDPIELPPLTDSFAW